MNNNVEVLKKDLGTLYYLAVTILSNRYDEVLELITHELSIIKMLPSDNEEVVLRELRSSSNIITAIAACESTQYSKFFVIRYNKLIEDFLDELKGEEPKLIEESGSNNNNNRGGDRKPKKVLQYSITGRFVKEWESMTEASRSGKFNQSTISHSCKTGKPHRNFYWRYRKPGPVPKQIAI